MIGPKAPTIVIEEEAGGTFSVYDSETGGRHRTRRCGRELPMFEAYEISARLDELGPKVWRKLN